VTYYRIASKHSPRQVIVTQAGASFKTPYYDELFVRDLGTTIPASDRGWDGKAWTVSAPFVEVFIRLVTGAFVSVEVVGEGT